MSVTSSRSFNHHFSLCIIAFLFLALNLCNYDNGGCAQRCTNLGNATAKCECNEGYNLTTDRRNCVLNGGMSADMLRN